MTQPTSGGVTMRRNLGLAGLLFLLIASVPMLAVAVVGDGTDPARNVALPCEEVATPGHVSRSERRIEHIANRCGIVGTDVELQSRKDATGRVRDYAFVGTMGAGLRIFDVTNPAGPTPAGAYADPGWQNDVQVRGDLALTTFDGVSGEPSSGSTCLKENYPTGRDQGVDLLRLRYDPSTARFTVRLLGCVANPPGGAHTATLHPGGQWLALSNSSSDWAVDVVDLRNLANDPTPPVRFRFIDASRRTADRCPPPEQPQLRCVVVKRPGGASAEGLWRPHDVSFSADGNTMYVAALNSTFVTDVREILQGQLRTISIIPNLSEPGGLNNARNIQLSHQADVTPDGKVLVISDERGGGIQNTECNTSPSGVVGGLHFWALRPLWGVARSEGATPATPKKLGTWFYPNPVPAGLDPLASAVAALPNGERACTVHVFRIGGNGTAGPGAIVAGRDGVSDLPQRQLVTGHYGAGVWWVRFDARPTSTDGTTEDSRATWGNTIGWNVMPGSEAWSAKEYRGHVFAGDMTRGFDVYRLK